jgi:sucrose-6-phosphate hydrolase SacC (GH32 family)
MKNTPTRTGRWRRAAVQFRTPALAIIVVGLSVTACVAQTATSEADADATPYREPYRPQFHFTPEVNWMNDPNGMVYFDGEYHLFYQYNPFGDKWGHMSWGHAVSADMVHWEHLPLAIPEVDEIMAFSGSAVVDWNNTSGFGVDGEPPLVAIYTGRRNTDNIQWQEIAFSQDRGRTWAKYGGNPVLDIGSTEFRDPKVFWHEESETWIMAVALAMDRKISFYSSPDLKTWTHLSDFGPAGAIGGVWECPDLFRLPVEGTPGEYRWVLQVDIGGGSIAGGSGAQYFVGDFDGTRFFAETVTPHEEVPEGVLFEAFEGEDLGTWEVTGEAFGVGPASGAVGNQNPVIGFLGSGLANSFHGGDATTGTLTSPEFRISHPHINFLISGGDHPGETGMELLVDGEAVRSATGRDSEILDWHAWDVSDLLGQTARIRIFDHHTGGWGHINVDHIMFADAPAQASVERADWVDWGKDFYAAQSWSDVAEGDGRRLWLAWMSNWQYAQDVPTTPWRSAMSIPREVKLRQYDEGILMIQEPVQELEALRRNHVRLENRTVNGTSTLLADAGVQGKTLEIIADFEPGDAEEFGLKVRQGNGEETIIGYNVAAGEIFVDRTRSGQVDFSTQFPGVHAAPLPPADGSITMHVFVDWSSVEVFANDGRVVITDLIFPDPSSTGAEVYSSGGEAVLTRVDAWQLDSTWHNGTQE